MVQDGDSARTAALSQLDAPGVVTAVVLAGVVATLFPETPSETADIAVRIPHSNSPCLQIPTKTE